MRSMTVDREGDTLAVVFSDRNISDEVRIMEISDDLTGIANKMTPGQLLILDFQNVEYFSSALVGQIVQLRNTTAKQGVEMRLRNVSPTILSILQVMHLDKVFQIEDVEA